MAAVWQKSHFLLLSPVVSIAIRPVSVVSIAIRSVEAIAIVSVPGISRSLGRGNGLRCGLGGCESHGQESASLKVNF